jgi:TPR repeat protein
MATDPVLSNPADPRVIDACVELLEAGRPLSEIINEAKRFSALKPEMLRPAEPEATKEPVAEHAGASEETAPESAEQEHPIAELVAAPRKVLAVWLSAAALLLVITTGTVGTAYFPRVTGTDTAAQAPASTTAVSPVQALSPTKAGAEPASQTSAEVANLVERGSMLVGSGDLRGAREIYARAVEAGDARAAIYLGTTYDPSFLKQARLPKVVRGDREAAAYWYRRARDLGASDAEALLKTVRR